MTDQPAAGESAPTEEPEPDDPLDLFVQRWVRPAPPGLLWVYVIVNVLTIGLAIAPEQSRSYDSLASRAVLVPLIVVSSLGCWRFARKGGRYRRELAPPSFGGPARTILVAMAVAGAVVVVTTWIGTLVRTLLGVPAGSTWHDPGPGQATPYLMLGLVAVLAAPLEEVLYRGVVQGLARRVAPATPVVVGSALLFAVSHSDDGYDAVHIGEVFATGLVFSWFYERTRALGASIAAHAWANVVAVAGMAFGSIMALPALTISFVYLFVVKRTTAEARLTTFSGVR